MPGPVTQIGLSAAAPDLLHILFHLSGFECFCSRDSESDFFYKGPPSRLDGTDAGSAVYIMYALPKGHLYSYAWLYYIDVLFGIDARSDLDSKSRVSGGGIILVRYCFRMDLAFNQFSLTERQGLFFEKEHRQLLIFCMIASQLAFLNWRTVGFCMVVGWGNI